MEDTTQTQTPTEENACPECGSSRLERDYVRSEVVCSNCGLVVDENIIDHGQEWASFSVEDEATRSRTGPPVSYLVHDKGLSTGMMTINVDAQKRRIVGRKRFHRMRLLDNRVRAAAHGERGLIQALGQINRTSSILGLPVAFREQTAVMYRKARKKDVIRGRSIAAMTSATIYIVCRLNNVPRTFSEIAKAANTDEKFVKRAYRAISRELKLTPRLSRPKDYLERFASRLDLSRKVCSKAREYLNVVPEVDPNGKSPLGTAAAVIYMAALDAGEPVTQKDVCRIIGVSEVTLRTRRMEIATLLNEAA